MELIGKFFMNIRLITKADIETLFFIRHSVKENIMSNAELSKLGYTPEKVSRNLLIRYMGWIINIDDRDVGFCMLDKLNAKITGLFVLPEYEGKGLGKILLAKAENFFKNLGFIKAYLDTSDDENTRAYKLYCKYNWRESCKLANNRIRLEKILNL